MVKTSYPLMSQKASGTLAGVLQFQNHGTRQVAGRRRVPKQPRTQAQLATRRYMAALSKLWNAINIADKATWGLLPNAPDLPNYNHYLRSNVNRFFPAIFNGNTPVPQNFHPSSAFPPTASTTPAAVTWQTPTPISQGLIVPYQVTAQNDGWILTGHRLSPGDLLCNFRNCIFAEPCPANGSYTRTIQPLPLGVMIIRCASSSRTGQTQTTFSFYFVSIPA